MCFLLKEVTLPLRFNQTTRSLHSSLPAWHFNNFCKYFSVLIISLNSRNVCVFCFCIWNNKLDIFQAICSIINEKFVICKPNCLLTCKGANYIFLKSGNRIRFVEQRLAPSSDPLDVTKFIAVNALSLVTLCCAAQVQLCSTNRPLIYLTEQHIFTLPLIIEGTTEKAPQFIMPLKPIYSQNIF